MMPQAGLLTGGIKVKYFSGAISYGAKTHNDAFLKIAIDLSRYSFFAPFIGFKKLLKILAWYLSVALFPPFGGNDC
jgi:hypothetical protein